MLFLGDGLKTPALSKLIINSPNLGSLTSQSVYSRLLQNYSETRHYQDYPWKFEIQYENNWMKVIEQSKEVDIHSLIGNIGGYVGLFLGNECFCF